MKKVPVIAYFFSSFPNISTTFLQREVKALQQQGWSIVTLANRPPKGGEIHPEDKGLLAATTYLTQLHPLVYTQYALLEMATNPFRFLKTLFLAIKWNDDFPWQRLVNLSHISAACVLSQLLRKHKVTHLHVHFAMGGASVALFHKLLTGMPYSLSIHGSDVLLPNPLIEKKLAHALCIISNCQYHVDNLTRKFPVLDSSAFRIIRLGIDLFQTPWKYEPQTLPMDRLHILHVGRMVTVKRHEYLIEACRRLQENGIPFLCRFIGDGPERARLQDLVNRAGLEDKIIFEGNCFSDFVAQAMTESHVVVLCSESEGTPMTLIEAMAKGRAVIAPNITAIPEMVDHGKSGELFERQNSEALFLSLKRFYDEPDKIRDFGVQGRRIVERDYDSARQVRELTTLFSELTKMDDAKPSEFDSLPKRLHFAHITTDLFTLHTLTDFIIKTALQKKRTIIGNHNQHSLYLFYRMPLFQRFYICCDFVHIDGMSLVLLGRMLGCAISREHRITYVDLVVPLFRAMNEYQLKLYYLGTDPKTLEEGIRILRVQYPGITIQGKSGYFDVNGPENAGILNDIREFAPNILMVGMGMPRQELWIAQNVLKLPNAVILPCGAVLDYIAGRVPTPPRLAGQLGLEWLFRLIAEPRRLWRRYVIEPFFIAQILLFRKQIETDFD